jgi:hypothetical protein
MHFRGFGSRISELHAKLDADTLLDFAIHRRQTETQGQENSCIKTMSFHSAMSRGRLMQ